MNKDIYAFAKYYFNIYRNPKATNFQVEEGFAEKCFSLGFEMDSGNSFIEKYPKAFENVEELDKIIDDVDDAHLLGTAIFSHWRYITHWSYCAHPLDNEYRPWFISAFGRLMAITAEDKTPPFVFFGNVKKIKIHSNNICYGYCPKTGDEVEQHLTITEDGRVWLTRYVIAEDLNFANYKKIEQKQFKIEPEKAKFLLSKFTKYFRDEYELSFATDVGMFEMWIDDDEGKKAYFVGPLISEFEVDGYDLSQLVRDTLDDQSLFVFDDNAYEKIKRITIDYKFTSVIIPADNSNDITWEYSDHLVIDRETETIEDVLKLAEQCDVTRKYHVAEGVTSFLDDLDIEGLFTEFSESEKDALPSPEGTAVYEVKVEFHRQEPRIISGTYDKQGLPKDWPEFIEDLYRFISFYGFGEMFDKKQYTRTYRKKNDYIFLSVKFGDYGKPYYYLTDDDTIQVGDQVVVPVGDEGAERVVRVSKKNYYSPENVPMPIERVKFILEKFAMPEDKVLYCPMCECEIGEDDCYDLQYDPLIDSIEGIITAEEVEQKKEICERCKYHDD